MQCMQLHSFPSPESCFSVELLINAKCVCTHCRAPNDSTENLEELIDLVSFDDVSGSLREAVKMQQTTTLRYSCRYYAELLNGQSSILFGNCSGSMGSWHGLQRRAMDPLKEIQHCCWFVQSRSAQEGMRQRSKN